MPNIKFSHFIVPRGIDLSHYNYIVMDGLYYSFLYIKKDGYPNAVRGGWMSAIINAGEGIDVDIHLHRENRSRTIDKVAQRIRLNRTKLKSLQDTSTDYEELTNSISAGYYIKNGIANNNEDLFYLSVFITVSAKSYEELDLAQAADGGYAQVDGYLYQRLQISARGCSSFGYALFAD